MYYMVIRTVRFTKTGVANSPQYYTGVANVHPMHYFNLQKDYNDEQAGKNKIFADMKLVWWIQLSEEEFKLFEETNRIKIFFKGE